MRKEKPETVKFQVIQEKNYSILAGSQQILFKSSNNKNQWNQFLDICNKYGRG